jgi:hypothetical protein
MWKLRGRDNKVKQWTEYGNFLNIADAARRILELEGDPYGALFFRMYVDPNPLTGKTEDPKSSPASNIRARTVSICFSAPFHKG